MLFVVERFSLASHAKGNTIVFCIYTIYMCVYIFIYVSVCVCIYIFNTV